MSDSTSWDDQATRVGRDSDWISETNNKLVVSTQLKNISQNGNLPQVGVKKKYLKPPPR